MLPLSAIGRSHLGNPGLPGLGVRDENGKDDEHGENDSVIDGIGGGFELGAGLIGRAGVG